VEDQAVGWRKGLLDESTLWSAKCQERYVTHTLHRFELISR
jgi:hypothetical protein